MSTKRVLNPSHFSACQAAQTGFDAVAFVNLEAHKLIVAIRGSTNAVDFVADANLGIAQYLANRQALLSYVGSYIATFGVTIAGHSLGGGLGQYLAYDAALTFPDGRARLSLQTQNGFGGILGIIRMHGSYDPAVLAGVTVRNFRHPDDPVSRIGGQAGGGVINLVDANPFMHDGVMFVSTVINNTVQALNAATGDLIWENRLGPRLENQVNATARTAQAADATGLKDTLEGLQMIGKALLGNAKGADKQLYARLLDTVKFTARGSEVYPVPASTPTSTSSATASRSRSSSRRGTTRGRRTPRCPSR